MDNETRLQLSKFATEHGPRKWKREISKYWNKGAPVPGYPALYALRNDPSYGPGWLSKVKFIDVTRGKIVSFHDVRQEITLYGGNYETHQNFLKKYGVKEEYRAQDVREFLDSKEAV